MRRRWLSGFAAGAGVGAAGVAAIAAALLGPGRTPADAQQPPALAPGSAVAMSALGDGSVLYADGHGRIAHFQVQAGRPALSGVFAIRNDRERFARDPEKRAPHGVYLDDLGELGQRKIVDAQAAFTREANLRAIDVGANARLEQLARDVYRAGDATLLLAALADPQYGTRRAAALVLGAEGYDEAKPALEEIATEKTGDGAERAKGLLKGLGR